MYNLIQIFIYEIYIQFVNIYKTRDILQSNFKILNINWNSIEAPDNYILEGVTSSL